MSKADNAEALICQKCIEDVNFADSIRLKCIEAERFFESLLNESIEPDIEVKQEDVTVPTFREELQSVEIAFTDNYEKVTVVEVINKAVGAKKS